MNAAVIAFSGKGNAAGERVVSYFERNGVTSTLTRCEKGGLSEWTEAHFDCDALVFIGSCGIAVRAIAPYIKSKLLDPAVIVCDEAGHFAISLLSGHVGGANALTEQIAAAVGAVPVITTASDLYDGEQPRDLVLGIGCRRGIPAEVIERTVTILLWNHGIPLSCVCEAATIDIKRDEVGLIDFARAHKLTLSFFTAMELADVPGEFTASERVLSVTGVDNVCERAAVLLGGQGRLILPKTSRDGIAVAVFKRAVI